MQCYLLLQTYYPCCMLSMYDSTTQFRYQKLLENIYKSFPLFVLVFYLKYLDEYKCGTYSKDELDEVKDK
jgi:hypothetical protein